MTRRRGRTWSTCSNLVVFELPAAGAAGDGGGGKEGTAASVATGLADYISVAIGAVTHCKLNAVRLALTGGVDVFFSEPDVAWCADAAATVTAYVGAFASAVAAGGCRRRLRHAVSVFRTRFWLVRARRCPAPRWLIIDDADMTFHWEGVTHPFLLNGKHCWVYPDGYT